MSWLLPLFFMIEIFSFFGTQSAFIGNIIFIIITLAVLILSLHQLSLGVMIALTELAIGSHGHLFNFTIGTQEIGIRLAIFSAVMLAWIIKTVINRQTKLFQLFNSKWYAILAVVIIWGITFGIIKQNIPVNIFSDGNAWLFFLYLAPFIDSLTTKTIFKQATSVFLAGISWTVIKSLALLYYFSHHFSAIKPIYRWVRDTGIGEITLLSGDFYRIFFQSHIYIAVGLFLVLSLLFLTNDKLSPTKSNYWFYILAVGFSAVSILNLSRSNWVGILLTGLVFVIIFFKYHNLKWKKLLALFANLFVILIASITLLLGTIYFPFPNLPAIDPSQMLKDRINLDESAVSSRWSQLPNLSQKMVNHPIIGSGFGTTVTYNSLDPRILEHNPSGEYTTYAFEWGYFDMILKIGLFGLIIYLGLLLSIGKNLWHLTKASDSQTQILAYGLLLGLISIVFVHIFSPYLNHPLGIGYVLFCTAMLQLYRHPHSRDGDQ